MSEELNYAEMVRDCAVSGDSYHCDPLLADLARLRSAEAEALRLRDENARLREAIEKTCETLCSISKVGAMYRRSPHKMVAIGMELQAALAPQPAEEGDAMAGSKHNLKGNCTDSLACYGCDICGEELCDVCHEHDEPRGQCSECPPCLLCDEIADHDARASAATKAGKEGR